jgi:acyl-CoA reductase-like NAD-dependent aldehyde dehydrogenase
MVSFQGALINGMWTGEAEGLKVLPVFNPATGQEIGQVTACQAEQANQALNAAKMAATTWGVTSINERAALIEAYKKKLLEKKQEIVDLLVLETGKVAGNADYDFTMLVDCLSFHVEEVRRHMGAVIPSPDGGALSYTKYTPVGVVVAVLTWNFPLLNLAYKIGPILATGCTCVLKPSEMTPLATSLCVSLLSEVGFPPGVVNLVNGTGLDLLEPLCASKVPRLLTTIGSTALGRRMIGCSATSIKRFSLELGGDAPVLVFPDADLDAAVADIVGLKFANAGQICVSPNRVFVHASVYEAFLDKAKEIAAKYVFGSGSDHGDKGEVLQPVASEETLSRLLGMVQDAKAKGARVLCGGEREGIPGYFMQPTILADVNNDMACQQTEIFGPIMPVRAFSDDDDVFALANESEYGLSSYVYTNSLRTTMQAEEKLMTGNVCVNGVHYSIELPHGGIKQSGNGKDISHLSLHDYYDIRRITLKR